MLVILISCSKDSDPDPDPVSGIEGFPKDWVFTSGGETNPPADPSVAEYEFIYTNKSAMFRDNILKSYPLKDLVEDEHCLFHVAEDGQANGKQIYTIQLSSDKMRFLGAGYSSNKEEVHLHIAKGTEIVVVGNPTRIVSPDGDEEGEYHFFIHAMPSVNGVTTVAIENVGMPGWYISAGTPGFNYAQNIVTLQKAGSPEKAPHWQCRRVD
jgi:hypothetical protein